MFTQSCNYQSLKNDKKKTKYPFPTLSIIKSPTLLFLKNGFFKKTTIVWISYRNLSFQNDMLAVVIGLTKKSTSNPRKWWSLLIL